MEIKQIVCEVCGELVDEDKYRRHLNNGHKDKKEFRCDLCGKDFTSNYNLQYHVAHHLNERNFVCNECPRAYNTAADLAQHQRIHEKQRDPYSCEFCGLVFQIRSRYNTHMRVHKTERGKGPKECPICGKVVQDLRRHNETVHLNIRNHECDICHKRFNKKSGLERHFLMVHEQQKNYICDLCGKAFGEKSLLTKHKSRHNSIRTSFYCTVCKKYVGEIKNHYETVHADLPFQCEHCYRRFAKLREYDNHLTSKHTKLRKWLCDLCGKRFVEKYQLKRHFRSHINVNGITEADISKLKPIYVGEDGDRKERKSPSKTPSNKTKYKKFECNLCGKKFAGKTLLKTHLIRHQNKKENYCNICKIYDDNIKEHYEAEHNDLEYTCEICFKKFARSSQLKNHNSTNHTNIGEHSCDICGRIFNNLAAIKSHIVVHVKYEKIEESEDDYNVFEQINDFDDDGSDYFEHETKPNDIENVNVESIVIKKEPEDEYDNICYEFSPTAMSIKSEHLSDQEDIDAFENDFTDDIKEEVATEVKVKNTVKKEIDQEIKCNVCDAIFPSKDKFKTHFMSEHVESNKTSSSCKECDKTFKDKKSLNNHFKNVHIKLDCEYCNEKFTSKYELDKHVKAEHESSDKASLMCSFCGKILMTERNLKLHIQAIHSGDRFPCTICDKRFSYKSAMYRHRDREHKTGRKHKCSKCPQQCATKHELRLHKEHHHNVNRKNTSPEHMCFYCGVCFPSSYVLSRHRRRVHGDEDPEIIRECGICKEVLKDLYWKRKHMAQVHLNGKKLKRTCGYCKTDFDLYEEFKAHIESHVGLFICITCGEFHFDAESLKSHQYTHKKIDCNLRKYICDHCGHRLFTKLQLSMHMLKHVKSFEVHYCDICGKGFKFASSLYTHRKYHGEGEFVCTYCGKKFARNSDLVNHIRTHTNEKPFKCQICDRGFSLKQLLQYHQQTHPETRVMFKCKKCEDQVFADKKQLSIHEDQAHPELRPYRCFICDMSFKHEHNLRKHNAHKHL